MEASPITRAEMERRLRATKKEAVRETEAYRKSCTRNTSVAPSSCMPSAILLYFALATPSMKPVNNGDWAIQSPEVKCWSLKTWQHKAKNG